ncbi:MAG: hypothetical protein AVDCRST_MAG48-1977, partial [uncultured Friedmanniella sp.]
CCALLVVLGSWLAPGPTPRARWRRGCATRPISIAGAALASLVRKLPGDAPVGLRVHGATVVDRSDEEACTTRGWSCRSAPATGTRCRTRSAATSPLARRRSPPARTRRPTTSAGRACARSCSSPTVRRPATPIPARPRPRSPARRRRRDRRQDRRRRLAVSGKVRNQLRCVAEAPSPSARAGCWPRRCCAVAGPGPRRPS